MVVFVGCGECGGLCFCECILCGVVCGFQWCGIDVEQYCVLFYFLVFFVGMGGDDVCDLCVDFCLLVGVELVWQFDGYWYGCWVYCYDGGLFCGFWCGVFVVFFVFGYGQQGCECEWCQLYVVLQGVFVIYVLILDYLLLI